VRPGRGAGVAPARRAAGRGARCDMSGHATFTDTRATPAVSLEDLLSGVSDLGAASGRASGAAHSRPEAAPTVCSLLVRRLVEDSRRIEPGDVFVAVRGESADGHRFAADAAARGAIAVLAERAIDGLSIPVVVVPELRARR